MPLEGRQLGVDAQPVVTARGGDPEADEPVHRALQRGIAADVVGVGADAEPERAGEVDEVDPGALGVLGEELTDLGPSTEQ